MIKSMTAFARETQHGEFGELIWEIKSVNHRYLEPHIRLPEELRGLEAAVRTRLTHTLKRGKIDCGLRFNPTAGSLGQITINRPFLEQLLAAGEEVAQMIGRPATPSPFELLRWPGALQETECDLGQVEATALQLLDRALEVLIATREREGARLAEMVQSRCEKLTQSAARVRERVPLVLQEFRQRLAERLAELQTDIDSGRVEQEIVVVASRLDVAEELDRLDAHVAEVGNVLERDEPVGRRLDFLMQELNREANTLGSKSNDLAMTREVVDMKVLIEQMREQVQNIE